MPSEFMRAALEESRAALGQTSPNPAVGCVLVREGRIVGRGRTQPPGQAHAEVMALREAGDRARGAEAYVTLEPCSHHGRTPPCTDALIAAGVAAVHFAIEDPDPRVAGSGARALRDAGLRVEEGDGAEEAERVNEAFLKHRRTGRPFVVAKFAASLDGRIAAASGDARWVSGEPARAWAHDLRTRIDAILVGSGTVIADDPHLTARPGGTLAARQPLRVVLDGTGRSAPTARVFDGAARTLVATTERAPGAWRSELAARGVEVAVLPAGDGRHVDLDALLALLGEREVLSLLVEGGGELLGALFDQRYVDRLYAVIAPLIIGASDAPAAVAGRGAAVMREAPRLRDVTVERLGEDVLIEGVPAWPEPPGGDSEG
ncbi:MAG: bifunctional diaminohydroxyphosphoribosylaminopyrimidine deaminase/5-amino-6-(5-phosphoribosylamino)uracil reductase RibD [Dehalococcoidia bacterium]